MASLVKALKFLNGIPTEINPNIDSLYTKSILIGGSAGTELTKAILDTLTAGSTSDAGSLHSHDGRYFQKAQTIAVSSGAPDAGAPIKTDARGKVDPSFIVTSDLIHGNLSGLTADDHTQYFNVTRGDARYYTKAQHVSVSTGAPSAGAPVILNAAGQIDSSMINSSSSNHEALSGLLGGAAGDHFHLTGSQQGTLTGGTLSDASSLHNHDTRYYTKIATDAMLALKANDNVVIKKDGSVAFTGAQSMGSFKLTNLADGTAATDASTKGQMDIADALKVSKSGDSMTGTLNMTGNLVINVADPVSATDAANKRYVDMAAYGFRTKESVRLATTVNLASLSGLLTIDGVVSVAGDRILVKDQTSAANNGIYVVASGIWTRAVDFDTSAKSVPGSTTFVNEGTVNHDLSFTLINDAPITLGSTALVFTETSRLGQIVAGIGLSKTGDTLNVNLGAGIAESPTDEVGLDLYVNGGLALVDPSTGLSSGLTNAQLSLKLDGVTLTKGAIGVKVSDSGITATQLASDSVTTIKILDANVTAAKLASDSVTTIKILDANVTTAKLAGSSVTAAKLAADTAGNGIVQNVSGALDVNTDSSTLEVVSDTVRIKDLGVTRAKIAALAIDSTKVDFGTTGTQINASLIPIVNTAARFVATTVDGALQEIAGETFVSVETAGEAIGQFDLVVVRRDATNANKMFKASAAGADNYVAAALVLQDITYTAQISLLGTSGNDIRVRYLNPSVINAALSVSVTSRDITVSLATDGTGAFSSTATQIVAAVNVHPTAGALVFAAVSGSGAAIQTSVAFTSLTGGMDYNDNGRWEVFGMALDAATTGSSFRVKKIGKLACTFVTAPAASDIGKTVYVSINRGKAVVGIAPTGTNEGIVFLGRLVSTTEVSFRAPVLRGVNG